MEPLEHLLPNACVLIIEDDEEMRSLLKDFFLEEGFETDSISNGYDAFGMLATKRFNLVVTDVRMPGLTGLDILPRIKKIQPGIPIIVITAFGAEGVRRRAFEKGANGYLEKPIHFEELRSLVRKVVTGREKRVGG